MNVTIVEHKRRSVEDQFLSGQLVLHREGNINGRQDDEDIVSDSLKSAHATFY